MTRDRLVSLILISGGYVVLFYGAGTTIASTILGAHLVYAGTR